MAAVPTTTSERWRFALKPASWPKLLVPFLLGQAIGIDATGRFSWAGFTLALAFTAADAVFVVTLNDFGDREVDAIKRRMFPTTSPKTIPDGVLPAHVLLFAGAIAGMVALATSVVAVFFERPLAIVLVPVALMIFVAYTLPPIRLNYRGGGELLEAAGVGVVLPWLSAYLQSGRAFMPALDVLPGFASLALASAVASGLSDERSDREGGKRTVVTMIGNTLARKLVLGCAIAGPVAWGLAALVPHGTPTLTLAMAALAQLLTWPSLASLSKDAVTDAFDAQSRFKQALHRASWESALGIAVLLAIGPWVGL